MKKTETTVTPTIEDSLRAELAAAAVGIVMASNALDAGHAETTAASERAAAAIAQVPEAEKAYAQLRTDAAWQAVEAAKSAVARAALDAQLAKAAIPALGAAVAAAKANAEAAAKPVMVLDELTKTGGKFATLRVTNNRHGAALLTHEFGPRLISGQSVMWRVRYFRDGKTAADFRAQVPNGCDVELIEGIDAFLAAGEWGTGGSSFVAPKYSNPRADYDARERALQQAREAEQAAQAEANRASYMHKQSSVAAKVAQEEQDAHEAVYAEEAARVAAENELISKHQGAA